MELILFVASAVLFVGMQHLPAVLIVGVVFHPINANSFLGASRRNPFGTPNVYAAPAMLGFAFMIGLYSLIF